MSLILNRLTNLSKSVWINLLLFFFSAIICCLSWIIFKPAYVLDPGLNFYQRIATDYQPQTQQLIEGKGIISFNYPPLFAAMLAGIYQIAHTFNISERVALAAYAVIFTALSTVILFNIARRIWGPLSALIVAVLWSTYPVALYSASYIGSETPFIVFLFLTFFFLIRLITAQRSFLEYLVLGLSVGLAMLTRPVAMGLPILFAMFLWIGTQYRVHFQRFVVQSLFFVIGILILVLPWEVFAYSRLQQVPLLSTGDVRSIVDGATYAYYLKYNRHVPVPDDVYALQKDFYNQSFQTSGQIANYFISQLSTRPRAVFLHYLIKAANSWYRTDSNQYDNLLLLIQIPYLLLFIVGAVMALRGEAFIRNVAIMVLVTSTYFWMMTILVLSIVRYMLPTIGLLFLLTPAVAYLSRPHRVDETSPAEPELNQINEPA